MLKKLRILEKLKANTVNIFGAYNNRLTIELYYTI